MNPVVFSTDGNIPVTFLASFLIWVLFAGLGYLWIVNGKVKKEVVLHALFACFIAWGFSEMIKNLIPTTRPFYENGLPPLTLTIPAGAAFPSTHTAVAFALGFSVWLHNKSYGQIFLALSILVGIGRVLGNVHFFLDIVGGAILGIASAYAVSRLHLDKLIK